ncbi:MAG: Gfo/Idh/MocA family oxidoreductase [Candidatus Latescibacteria bacterium]|nr:Gfo/Idh/MocA family oxidoreductase [Candidatus Latescibacterota bacterium]
MGMIGGGVGAFIGAVHRMAATLDGECEMVCGAFSSTPERSKASGKALYLPPDRVYGSYEEMITREKKLAEGDRMDFVSIVTPNNLHYPLAKMALENGFPVMCDKPMTYSLAEAKKLKALVGKTGLLFGLTHNYTGYPMVKEAREMVLSGKIGNVRKIVVEYPQGWLATKLEDTGQKQASWRGDPKRAGISNCMGDIGTHAENLAEYITGLKITEMCADLTSFVKGRVLDDDGNVLLRFDNGARGVLFASQIAVGEENSLRIRIWGEKGGLEWFQQEPNTLYAKWLDQPTEIMRTNMAYLSDRAKLNARLPAGHPEAFIEAFANVYRNYIMTLKAVLDGKKPKPEHLDFPSIEEGIRGMAFIETVVEASASDRKWMPFKQ